MSRIDQTNPTEAWQPWQPTPADPWNRKWAAHLFRRATFGPSRRDLIDAERDGLQATLDRIFHGAPHALERRQTLEDIGRVAADRDDGGDQLRSWWVYAMLESGDPLREKMTLFWHNHFATSIAKVQSASLMFRQNSLLREHALGKFEPFLQAMSKDPAMLIWLDSNSNIKGKPNENYAREVMELFSLGVGNYTEKDIREAARAFTGWHTDGQGFKFVPGLHDYSAKTFFGRTGQWNGNDIVRIVLDQAAAARFLVGKLYSHFISETAVPTDAFLAPLCDSFRKSGYDVALLLRTMLSSRHFYSEQAFRRRIKSPVEFVLGAVRGVADPAKLAVAPQELARRISAMGQELFAPPNVKGWPGGRHWLNTSTIVERDNFAGGLAMGSLTKEALLLPSSGSPAGVVEDLLQEYLPGGIRPDAKARIVSFVAEGKPQGPALAERVRETVHAILAMPEYQLA
jgi:uncharacterized protein (DUF1800 family)